MPKFLVSLVILTSVIIAGIVFTASGWKSPSGPTYLEIAATKEATYTAVKSTPTHVPSPTYIVDTPTPVYIIDTPIPLSIDEIKNEAMQDIGALDIKGGSNCLTTYGGDGFIIDSQGHMATAKHVADQISTCAATVDLYGGGLYSVSKLWESPIADVAVLQLSINNTGYPSLPSYSLPISSNVQVGDTVYTMGSKGQVNDGFHQVISSGKITGISGCEGAPDGIWFDAFAMAGYSGSSLLDSSGNVIGIIDGGWAYNNSCAIPISYLNY